MKNQSENTPINPPKPDDVITQLVTLREMYAYLPDGMRLLFEQQHTKLVRSILDLLKTTQHAEHQVLIDIQALNADVKYLVFDLEATRRERDAQR